MSQEEYRFTYQVYDSINDLDPEDAEVLKEAVESTQIAYAPYSNFKVGAAARLINGELVRGSNQENASYPVGMCAERSLLATASSMFPNVPIRIMAVTYDNVNGTSDKPVSPCGMCRQALVEQEFRYSKPIRLIMAGLLGKVYILERAGMLLPFGFTSDDMELELVK